MRAFLLAMAMSPAVASPLVRPTDAAAQSRDDRYEQSRDDRYEQSRDDRYEQSGRRDRYYARGRDDRGDHRWRGDRDDRGWDPSSSYQEGNYRERRLGRNDRIYRGQDGRSYCRRSDGTTGLVVGAVGGGVLANVIGGGTLGTLAGAGGGALLGRSIDRGNVKCR